MEEFSGTAQDVDGREAAVGDNEQELFCAPYSVQMAHASTQYDAKDLMLPAAVFPNTQLIAATAVAKSAGPRAADATSSNEAAKGSDVCNPAIPQAAAEAAKEVQESPTKSKETKKKTEGPAKTQQKDDDSKGTANTEQKKDRDSKGHVKTEKKDRDFKGKTEQKDRNSKHPAKTEHSKDKVRDSKDHAERSAPKISQETGKLSGGHKPVESKQKQVARAALEKQPAKATKVLAGQHGPQPEAPVDKQAAKEKAAAAQQPGTQAEASGKAMENSKQPAKAATMVAGQPGPQPEAPGKSLDKEAPAKEKAGGPQQPATRAQAPGKALEKQPAKATAVVAGQPGQEAKEKAGGPQQPATRAQAPAKALEKQPAKATAVVAGQPGQEAELLGSSSEEQPAKHKPVVPEEAARRHLRSRSQRKRRQPRQGRLPRQQRCHPWTRRRSRTQTQARMQLWVGSRRASHWRQRKNGACPRVRRGSMMMLTKRPPRRSPRRCQCSQRGHLQRT